MSREGKLSPLWLLLALVGAVIAACADRDPGPARGAAGRGIYVPAAWQSAREVIGHEVHVTGHRVPCASCHDLGETSLGETHPERCAACHVSESGLSHAALNARERFDPSATTDCRDCHAFTAEGTGHPPMASGAVRAGDCARCHAEAQGSIPAVAVHGASDCVSCHQVHLDSEPAPASCTECHRDIATTHAADGKAPTEVCTTCHEHQHAPASDALATCAACHAEKQPIVPASALFPEGHRECVACHRPHTFAPGHDAGTDCRSCHAGIRVLAAPRVGAHAACESCHAPHDVLGSAPNACAKCHDDVHPDHPKHGPAGSCVGCHDPHPPAAHADERARRCTSCHQTAATDHGFHGATACSACHEPHQFRVALSDHAACGACHAAAVTGTVALAGHQACESCHGGLPHKPSALLRACDTCHADVHRASLPGHQACSSCHEPHGGAITAACSNCHAAEHASAPKGHRKCASCHEPHGGATAGAPCAGCHAEQARSGHGELSGDCSSCHRAHGPGGVAKPPACASCHESETLPGLHREERHQDCARCHTGHGEPPSAARTACLGCHTERQEHFPEAARCASCHLFSKTR